MTTQSWKIWSMATLCGVVVLGAMGLVTRHFLEQKNEDLQRGASAYTEERIRLAMWRLDTIAAAIVGAEDARPVQEFFQQENADGAAKVAELSKLFKSSPDYANTYWNLSVHAGAAVVSSPLVPTDEVLLSNGLNPDYNFRNEDNFQQLENLLEQQVSASPSWNAGGTNRDLTCMAVHMPLETPMEAPVQQQAEYSQEKEKSTKPVANAPATKEDFSLGSITKKGTKGEEIVRAKNAPVVQQRLSKADMSKRQSAIGNISQNYLNPQQAWGAEDAKEKQAKKLLPQNDGPMPETGTKSWQAMPFKPIWLDGELMLVRGVTDGNQRFVQGVWLNVKEVKQRMHNEISDLFPQAELQEAALDIQALIRGDEVKDERVTRMLKLPFLLMPNESPVAMVDLAEVLRGPIGVAWMGALFALLAGFIMLRSVMQMSERRASFVSSVTHELRTPLTTFRLYSDMLASGLVKDEAARQRYTETLRLESERLTHLVENVLSYSRIERGSARAKLAEVALGDLLERFEQRLRDRASEAGLQLSVKIEPHARESKVSVDMTAVEQIIFNLIDNAAKYASGDGCGDQLTIHAGIAKNVLKIAVCDQGPGIARRERRRLFKPFHKSAQQAAETKPGVGLGLALCSQLAKAMGGTLSIDECPQGACFTLKIPVHRKIPR